MKAESSAGPFRAPRNRRPPAGGGGAFGGATSVVFAALCAVLSACNPLSREFNVSGTITIAAPLQAKAPKSNSVLFVIARNKGGVPVAVHRIVNPQFPVSFTLTEQDLLVPGSRPENPLQLEVQMNSHGNVGMPVRGDLEGTHRDPVYPGERGVHIVIDKEV